MIASYYGYSLEGTMAASDEPLDAEGYTAAHSTLSLGTRLLVGYRGESVWVTTNDHGSSVAG